MKGPIIGSGPELVLTRSLLQMTNLSRRQAVSGSSAFIWPGCVYNTLYHSVHSISPHGADQPVPSEWNISNESNTAPLVHHLHVVRQCWRVVRWNESQDSLSPLQYVDTDQLMIDRGYKWRKVSDSCTNTIFTFCACGRLATGQLYG